MYEKYMVIKLDDFYWYKLSSIWKRFLQRQRKFEFSNCWTNIPFYDSVINKVIGKITDRDEVIPILEFVTLKSKM